VQPEQPERLTQQWRREGQFLELAEMLRRKDKERSDEAVERLVRGIEAVYAQSQCAQETQECLWHAGQRGQECARWSEHPTRDHVFVVLREAEKRLSAKHLSTWTLAEVISGLHTRVPVRVLFSFVGKRWVGGVLPHGLVSAPARVDEIARDLEYDVRAMTSEHCSIVERALAFHCDDVAAAQGSTLAAIDALNEARAKAQLAWTDLDAAFERARAACEKAAVELDARLERASCVAQAK
jgi:hypothetical protein